MSPDGSIIVITYWFIADAEVFMKASDGFMLYQSLPSSSGAIGVIIGALNSIILNLGGGNIKCYTKGTNDNYQVTQILAVSSTMIDIQICSSEEYIALSYSLSDIDLYRKNGGSYSLHSTQGCPSGFPTSATFSQDCQWMALVCPNHDIKIFQNLPPFTEIQTLSGTPLIGAAISDSHLFTVRDIFSSYLAIFFKYNGS